MTTEKLSKLIQNQIEFEKLTFNDAEYLYNSIINEIQTNCNDANLVDKLNRKEPIKKVINGKHFKYILSFDNNLEIINKYHN